jgi:hypothetical protein
MAELELVKSKVCVAEKKYSLRRSDKKETVTRRAEPEVIQLSDEETPTSKTNPVNNSTNTSDKNNNNSSNKSSLKNGHSTALSEKSYVFDLWKIKSADLLTDEELREQMGATIIGGDHHHDLIPVKKATSSSFQLSGKYIRLAGFSVKDAFSLLFTPDGIKAKLSSKRAVTGTGTVYQHTAILNI